MYQSFTSDGCFLAVAEPVTPLKRTLKYCQLCLKNSLPCVIVIRVCFAGVICFVLVCLYVCVCVCVTVCVCEHRIWFKFTLIRISSRGSTEMEKTRM